MSSRTINQYCSIFIILLHSALVKPAKAFKYNYDKKNPIKLQLFLKYVRIVAPAIPDDVISQLVIRTYRHNH